MRTARGTVGGAEHDVRRRAHRQSRRRSASGSTPWRVSISDGRVLAISTRRLAGRDVIDVTGLVVAPGF
jgi:N-acyl-D-aspartate/D-glutamate deacylase